MHKGRSEVMERIRRPKISAEKASEPEFGVQDRCTVDIEVATWRGHQGCLDVGGQSRRGLSGVDQALGLVRRRKMLG